MESKTDKRRILEEEVFTYRITKNRKVFISCEGKQVTVLRGNKADEFIAKVKDVNGKDVQLIVAKATGNFKRGNERPVKQRK